MASMDWTLGVSLDLNSLIDYQTKMWTGNWFTKSLYVLLFGIFLAVVQRIVTPSNI